MILAVCQLQPIFSAALHKIATEFQTYIVVIIDGLTVCKCRNGLGLRHCMLARFCDAASVELRISPALQRQRPLSSRVSQKPPPKTCQLLRAHITYIDHGTFIDENTSANKYYMAVKSHICNVQITDVMHTRSIQVIYAPRTEFGSKLWQTFPS